MLKANGLSEDHIESTTRRFEVHFFPWLGHKPIASVTDDDVLACIRRIEGAKLIDTAHRALSQCGAMFRCRGRSYQRADIDFAPATPTAIASMRSRTGYPTKYGFAKSATEMFSIQSRDVRKPSRLSAIFFGEWLPVPRAVLPREHLLKRRNNRLWHLIAAVVWPLE